jgi:hypothetical protein
MENPLDTLAGCSSDDCTPIAGLRRPAKKKKARKAHRVATGLTGATACSQAPLSVEAPSGKLQPPKQASMDEEASQALHSNRPEESVTVSREANMFMVSFYHRVFRSNEANIWCSIAVAGLASFTRVHLRKSVLFVERRQSLKLPMRNICKGHTCG